MDDTITLLLDRGAKIDAVDNEGKAAIDHAAVRKRGNITKLLKVRGANRSKLTLFNHAAATLSDVMHWTVEACREWERDWEIAEMKKVDKRSSDENSGNDLGVEEQRGQESPDNKDDENTDADSEKTKVNLAEEDSVYTGEEEQRKRHSQGSNKDGDATNVASDKSNTKPMEGNVHLGAEKEKEQEDLSVDADDDGNQNEMEVKRARATASETQSQKKQREP